MSAQPTSGEDGEVDIVILTWNDGPLLDAAIRSVQLSEGVAPNIIVIDNGSDPPASVPHGVGLVRNEANRGVAGGRNQGAAEGSAAVLCFLDSDAELAPTSLRRLLEPLDDPSVAVTVPVFRDQLPEASGGAAPTLRVKVERGLGRRATYAPAPRPDGASTWDVDFGIGACQLMRRDVFEAVGRLDDSIFYGPEDVDFCLRVRAAGHRVVQVADADVWHPPRRAFRRPLTRRGLQHGWSIVRHLWRHRRS